MRTRSMTHCGLWIVLFSLASATPYTAQGQGYSFDPYSPLTNQYNAYAYPSVPTNLASPGAARREMDLQQGPYSTGSRFNQFDRFSDYSGIDRDRFSNESNAARRGNGIGIPYTQSYRQFDRDAGRLDTASEVADKSFYEGQQERYRLYLEAMREKDPKKRAQMLKEVNHQTAVAGRDTSFDKKPAPAKKDATKSKAPLIAPKPKSTVGLTPDPRRIGTSSANRRTLNNPLDDFNASDGTTNEGRAMRRPLPQPVQAPLSLIAPSISSGASARPNTGGSAVRPSPGTATQSRVTSPTASPNRTDIPPTSPNVAPR